MKVLIAGGGGMLGGAFARLLRASGHHVVILTRTRGRGGDHIHWDGTNPGEWEKAVQDSDAVVNATGYGLEHWPWTDSMKGKFISSRVQPARLLTAAIQRAAPRPRTFIQFSGINRYGLQGTAAADECAPAADDFLAQLTVNWENATLPLQDIGVRLILARNAVVLNAAQGLFPLMALPSRLFLGGRFGTGRQTVPWIHAVDHTRALQRLLEDTEARGPYNLVAPEISTNADFMRALCDVLKRPFWLHLPAAGLRLLLGEMAQLILEGRPSRPRRLLEAGFVFDYPTLRSALRELLSNQPRAQVRTT